MLKWRHYIIIVYNRNNYIECGYSTVYTKSYKKFYDDFKRLYKRRYGYYPEIVNAYIDNDDFTLTIEF